VAARLRLRELDRTSEARVERAPRGGDRVVGLLRPGRDDRHAQIRLGSGQERLRRVDGGGPAGGHGEVDVADGARRVGGGLLRGGRAGTRGRGRRGGCGRRRLGGGCRRRLWGRRGRRLGPSAGHEQRRGDEGARNVGAHGTVVSQGGGEV